MFKNKINKKYINSQKIINQISNIRKKIIKIGWIFENCFKKDPKNVQKF